MTREQQAQQRLDEANASLRRQHAAAAQITTEIKDGIIVRPTEETDFAVFERQSNRFCHGIIATLVDNDITRRDLEGLLESRSGVAYSSLGGEWRAALQFARNNCDIFEFLGRLDPTIADLEETPHYILHQGALRGLPLTLVSLAFGAGGFYTPTVNTNMGRVSGEKINVRLLTTALRTMGRLTNLAREPHTHHGRMLYKEFIINILLNYSRDQSDNENRARYEGYEAHLREQADMAAYRAAKGV